MKFSEFRLEKNMMRQRRSGGFTLIELMITIAVIAILGAIAYPSYVNYVKRGKVAEATSALSNARSKFEQYYQDQRKYSGYVLTDCSPAIIGTKYFDYSCPATDITTNTFKITATGKTSEGMAGYEYTLNEKNEKTSKVPGASDCSKTWITKPGDQCL